MSAEIIRYSYEKPGESSDTLGHAGQHLLQSTLMTEVVSLFLKTNLKTQIAELCCSGG